MAENNLLSASAFSCQSLKNCSMMTRLCYGESSEFVFPHGQLTSDYQTPVTHDLWRLANLDRSASIRSLKLIVEALSSSRLSFIELPSFCLLSSLSLLSNPLSVPFYLSQFTALSLSKFIVYAKTRSSVASSSSNQLQCHQNVSL